MSQPTESESPRQDQTNPAAEHVAEARALLNSLQKKIGEHPELAEAILKLETALSVLTVKTAGLL